MATNTMPSPKAPETGHPPRTRGVPGGRPPGPAQLAPRHTRPFTPPVTGPQARPVTGATPRPRPRTPFILLLIGLLGGAMVSLLVISTTLAQGAFQITSLQQQNANLTRQEQTLNNAVAQAADPAVIAKEAQQFGMVQNPNLSFINLKNGKIISGKVSKSDAEINVPGYTP
jgi:cell division protein FtsB